MTWKLFSKNYAKEREKKMDHVAAKISASYQQ